MTAQPSNAALELSGVSKRFGSTRALCDIALSVRSGSVHALLGGNGSGKSTTLKVLAGVHPADPGGVIRLDGVAHATNDYSGAVARGAGLRFVHQNLGLVPGLSVCENFALEAGYPTRSGRVSWSRLRAETTAHLEAFGIDLDSRAPAGSLRPSDQALVAIVRALRPAASLDGAARTLVLDEPTACLPHHEASRLIDALQERRAMGQTIVYVSHRLPEVLDLADDITVLRDGSVAATGPVADFDGGTLVDLMAGQRRREAVRGGTVGAADRGRTVLEARDVVSGSLRGVSLSVTAGEVVGVAGILGSGRTSLLHALFGERQLVSGELKLAGVTYRPRRPREAMAQGVAMVPQDRVVGAVFPDQSVTDNVHAGSVGRYWRKWRIDRPAMRRDALSLMREYGVRAASHAVPLSDLSGGNQQKVVIARWLRRSPRLLLLDEPTQGIDVVARAHVHRQVRAHADRGNAVVIVSSDFAELTEVCDRVLVLREGRVVADVAGRQLTEAHVARLAHLDLEQIA